MKRLLIMAAVAAGLTLPLPVAAAHAATGCAPGYQPCLPKVADLDCADIPDHKKPIRVTGNDQYRLDRDGDGTACEIDGTKPDQPAPDDNDQAAGVGEGGAPQLPVTGPVAVPLALAGIGLVAAGGAGVYVSRRRRIRFQA